MRGKIVNMLRKFVFFSYPTWVLQAILAILIIRTVEIFTSIKNAVVEEVANPTTRFSLKISAYREIKSVFIKNNGN